MLAATLAIDGDYTTCSRTMLEEKPWLTIDLGAPYMVAALQVTGQSGQWPVSSQQLRRTCSTYMYIHTGVSCSNQAWLLGVALLS